MTRPIAPEAIISAAFWVALEFRYEKLTAVSTPCLPSSLGHLLRLDHAGRERLLAHSVQSPLDRHQRTLHVGVIGSHNGRRVELLLVEHLIGVLVGGRYPVPVGEFARASRHDVRAGHDLAAFDPAKRIRVGVGHAAGPYDS